jgi:oligopeptide transport system substrate-binding protein
MRRRLTIAGNIVSLFLALVLMASAAISCGGGSQFEVSSLTITPPKVAPGKPATIAANVANPGKSQGTYNAVLKVAGNPVETKTVVVNAGAKETVSFQYSTDTLGTHQIALDKLSGTLEVVKPAEFQVSALATSPAEIIAGKPVTVTAEVSNSGGLEGTYAARLTVDGKAAGSKDVKVDAGATQKVSFTAPLDAGSHTIELGGATRTVKALKPAELKASPLKVTPALVLQGQTAAVEADVTNIGEVKGAVPAMLTVNGVESDTRLVTLEPGATSKVSFPVVRDLSGKYDLSISGANGSLTVAEAKTYTSQMFNYSISYPSEWTLNEEKPDVIEISRQLAGILSIGAELVSASVTQEEYARLLVSREIPADWKTFDQREVTKDGAVTGFQTEFSFTQLGNKGRGTILVMKRGTYGFAVFAVAPESVWELNKPLLNACIQSFQPPVVATGSYTNTTHGFSMTLPPGWGALETGEKERVLYGRSPTGQPYVSVFLFVQHLQQTTTAQKLTLDAVGKPKDLKIVSQGDVTLGDGAKGYEAVVTFTSSAGLAHKDRVVSVIRGTQGFMLLFSAWPQDYDKQRSTIEQCIRSFTLVEPKPFGVSRQNSLFLYESDIVTLDPAVTEDAPEDIVGGIFSGLVRIDKDLKVVPDLAEKWEISPDGKTYTFHLRENAKFHSGKPVTAADFKFSWERALDPKTKSYKARTYLGDIVGADEVLFGKTTELSGVKVIDDLTLEVNIDSPKPYFLGKLAYVTAYVVDRGNVARGKNWITEPNGTGPFKLKQWKKDELLILERNNDYYQSPAKLENIVFQLFSGYPMMMYERGEIDIAGVSLNNLERVQDPKEPLNKELLTSKSMGMGYLGFNVTKSPFDDPKVRRAFALALNMDKIIEVSLKGNSERAAGYVPPGIPGHNPELKPLPFDAAQAKQLIKESKYGGVDRLPSVTLYVFRGAGAVVEAMVGMWQQNLGVEVKIQAIKELEEFYQRKHRREFAIFSGGWNADYVDPQNFLEVLFQGQSDENYFAYANPAVDAALKEAAVERDEAARLKKYQEIERMILQDLPAVPFSQSGKENVVVKPYVKGFSLPPINVNVWRDMSIAPH